jgi:pSer/pThr/pTyr-binding forkhead associated (FHA) protein
MPTIPPDGKPPQKPGPDKGFGGTFGAAKSKKPPEPVPVTVDSTRLLTWLTIKVKDTYAEIAPNRQATLGIGKNSGADVAFAAPDGTTAANGIYLTLLTDGDGGVELKLADAEKKAAIETPDGIKPLSYKESTLDGWIKFDPKVDKIAFGGLQFFSLNQEERQNVELTVTVGDEGRTLDISQEILIGREEENGQGQLLSETVSRRHARIYQGKDGLFIEDRGSMNGTFIARPGEREPVKVKTTPELLKPGDRVWFGSVKGAESAYLDVVPVRLISHGRPRPDVVLPPPATRMRAERDTLQEDEVGSNKSEAVLDTGRVDAQN